MNSEDIKLPVVQEVTTAEMEESSMKLLNPKQQRFVHMYLAGAHTLSDIADLLDVSLSTIRNWLRNPEVKSIINEIQGEEDDIVKQGLKALRLKALWKMGELVDSKIDGISYQAARDILDRTGHKAPTKQEVTVEVKTFEQQINELITNTDSADDFIEGYCEVIEDGKEE